MFESVNQGIILDMGNYRAVAFLHDSFPLGGAEKVTLGLTPYLMQHGYKVIVFTPRYKPELLSDLDVCPEIVVLPNGRRCNSAQNLEVISQAIKDHKIGVFVNVWNRFNDIASLRKSFPHLRFVFANHGQPLWEITAKKEQQKQSRKTVKGKLKWIYSGHWIKYGLLNYGKTKTMRSYRKRLSEYDKYVVLCEEYGQELVHRLKVCGNNIVSIGNSTLIPEHINLDKENVILYVGRLSYDDKRVDRLLRMWGRVQSEHQDWKLIIVGDGVERKNLEDLSVALGLERVVFAGFQKELYPFYNIAAILCLTSTYESWGLCLCEAQACGVVPIAFACSAGVNFILGKNSGVLIKPFDEDAYVEALNELMDNSEYRKKLQGNVLNKCRDYAPDAVNARWLTLFDTL